MGYCGAWYQNLKFRFWYNFMRHNNPFHTTYFQPSFIKPSLILLYSNIYYQNYSLVYLFSSFFISP